jgi:hypothetical protein
MSEIKDDIFRAILDADPQALGEIEVVDSGHIWVSGRISTSLPKKDIYEVVENSIPGKIVAASFGVNNGLVVRQMDSKVTTIANKSYDPNLHLQPGQNRIDEVGVLHFGEMEVLKLYNLNSLAREEKELLAQYKRLNFETRDKIRSAVDVAGFIAPIVLDCNFKVIDGLLRLQIAKDAGIPKVLVVVLDTDDERTDFLRLVLNRSSEFQRWKYDEVDSYVDAWPQLQPVLEPLGFFGNNILPVSFFGNTVIEYRLDEYNQQMQQYSQDIGLAEWAKMMRQKNEEEETKRLASRKPKPMIDDPNALF